jgi:hypothetical protein
MNDMNDKKKGTKKENFPGSTTLTIFTFTAPTSTSLDEDGT